MHRIHIQKLRGPIRDFRRHSRHFFIAQKKGDARLIHKEGGPHRAAGAGPPGGKTNPSVAGRRGERGAPDVRVLIQDAAYEWVQAQGPLLLGIPPVALKDHRQLFLGSAGGVFQFHQIVFQQPLKTLTGLEKIPRKIPEDVPFAGEGKLVKTNRDVNGRFRRQTMKRVIAV